MVLRTTPWGGMQPAASGDGDGDGGEDRQGEPKRKAGRLLTCLLWLAGGHHDEGLQENPKFAMQCPAVADGGLVEQVIFVSPRALGFRE